LTTEIEDKPENLDQPLFHDFKDDCGSSITNKNFLNIRNHQKLCGTSIYRLCNISITAEYYTKKIIIQVPAFRLERVHKNFLSPMATFTNNSPLQRKMNNPAKKTLYQFSTI